MLRNCTRGVKFSAPPGCAATAVNRISQMEAIGSDDEHNERQGTTQRTCAILPRGDSDLGFLPAWTIFTLFNGGRH